MLGSALVLLTLLVAPGGLLKDPEADRLLGEAQAAFETDDYAKAAKLLEEAYLIEPNAQLLYPWAQAERSLGNCEAAIDLYERFLESKPSKQFVEAAQGNIDRCREQLAEDAAMVIDDGDDAGTGEDLLGESAEAEPEPQPEPEPAPVTKPDPKTDAPPRAWYKDPAGGVLVGLGIAGVGAGGALLGIASSRANAVGDADLNSEYVDMREGATKLNGGGIAALSIGGALLLSGVIRWAVVAKKNKARNAGAASLWIPPTGSPRAGVLGALGMSWSGYF